MEDSIVKKWQASDIYDTPYMEPEGVSLLESKLLEAKVFLEYGAGGSTVFAAKCGIKTILSVESDKGFLGAVSEKLKILGYNEVNHVPVFVDIGPTGDWGVPIDPAFASKWPNYCVKVWDSIKISTMDPDVILIDGRFRVSCFLASLSLAKGGACILFDDYVNRPEYHVIEKHLMPVSTSGRMAEFIVPKYFNTKPLIKDLVTYSTSYS